MTRIAIVGGGPAGYEAALVAVELLGYLWEGSTDRTEPDRTGPVRSARTSPWRASGRGALHHDDRVSGEDADHDRVAALDAREIEAVQAVTVLARGHLERTLVRTAGTPTQLDQHHRLHPRHSRHLLHLAWSDRATKV
jgi:hypothetical protein